jgi:tripartite-type tricarboxylate transporter receptor subunit TctC
LSKTPLPFDSLRDFAPVASLARTGLFLVVHPALPAKNLPEFIALAKAKPGALNSAAPGGSINQLATEMFNSLAGVKLVHIPYKGSAPAMADVIAGQAQLSFNDPKVPTFTQAGLPGFDVSLWFGLLAPAGTPKAVVERLNAEVANVITTPDFREKIAAQGLEVFVSTPAQYGTLLKNEYEKFGRIVKAAGITPE